MSSNRNDGAWIAALSIGVMPGEDSGADGDDEDDGFADQISAAAVWEKDNLYIAAAIDDNVFDKFKHNFAYTYMLEQHWTGTEHLGNMFADKLRSKYKSTLLTLP